MNDEERQRTMDFILQQQAQFTANMQRLEEQQTQLASSQQKADGRLKRVERVVVQMAQQFRQERRDLRERIGALVDAQITSEDKASRTEDVMKRLEESHVRSEARLTRVEDLTERNSKDIAALAKVVADMARGRNGDNGAA
jgi:hypothetical protein